MPGGLDPYIGAYYQVRKIDIYKGKAPARLEVFSENTTGRTPLDIGKRYLLFLERQRGRDQYVRPGDLMADACGNSRELRHASAEVRLVRRLARTRR